MEKCFIVYKYKEHCSLTIVLYECGASTVEEYLLSSSPKNRRNNSHSTKQKKYLNDGKLEKFVEDLNLCVCYAMLSTSKNIPFENSVQLIGLTLMLYNNLK